MASEGKGVIVCALAHSPKTTLELLRRQQKHRVQLGEQRLTGFGKTTPAQLDRFKALGITKPA